MLHPLLLCLCCVGLGAAFAASASELDELPAGAYQSVCSVLKKHELNLPKAIKMKSGCSVSSTGNALAHVYMAQVAATAAGVELRTRCRDPDVLAVTKGSVHAHARFG